MKRKLLKGVLALLITAELGLRIAGVTDFPTYDVDDGIGYVPSPGQSGAFLRTHDWVFNEHSMGTARPWSPDARVDVLLIGNSIVMGGNPYRQQDKLGPLIERRLGTNFAIWPIAAGGWTNVNQSVYMQRHPEVRAGADLFVWEFMSGGVSDLSRWRGEYVFPQRKPLLATWYALRRYVLPKVMHFNMDELPPTGESRSAMTQQFEAQLAQLATKTGASTPGILFIYPAKAEYEMATQHREWLSERPLLTALAAKYKLAVADLSANPAWNKTMYRDDVHPTEQGNVVIADMLSTAILAHSHRPSPASAMAQNPVSSRY